MQAAHAAAFSIFTVMDQTQIPKHPRGPVPHRREPSRFGAAKEYARAHKLVSAIALVVIAGAGWAIYARMTASGGGARYVLAAVGRGTIVSSVTASGQVSVSDQFAVKPKVSGDVVSVAVSPGDKVKAGDLLVSLDATDAERAVRDAQANLDSAQLSLQKLEQPATDLSIIQAKNALQTATDTLATAYTTSQSDLTSAFLDTPGIITGLEDINFGSEASHGSQWNMDFYENQIAKYDINALSYRDLAYNDYTAMKNAYDAAFAAYRAFGPNASTTEIESQINSTTSMLELVAEAIKSTNALVQHYEDEMNAHNLSIVPLADTELSSLSDYTTKNDGHLSTLRSDSTAIQTGIQSIAEKQESLNETIAGANPIDIQSAELDVTKAKNALADAQSTLDDYNIRAPFDGTVASVDVHSYDSVASGQEIATLVTNELFAELSLNEVDAEKVKAGDRATLTFDALPGVTLTGKVAEIDTVGTVSQGVVSYDLKIAFDTPDSRIKPSMTVSAAIITGIRENVLTVPSAAVRVQNSASYVQVFNPPLPDTGGSQGVATPLIPKNVLVTTGISDDTNIEILSGLSENEQYVVQTISPSGAGASQSSVTSLFGGRGGGRPGGGVFIQRGG